MDFNVPSTVQGHLGVTENPFFLVLFFEAEKSTKTNSENRHNELYDLKSLQFQDPSKPTIPMLWKL